MAEETTLPEPQSNSSDILRKVAAAIIGVFVIILIVLAAKWIGDRVRERFFPGTTVGGTTAPTPTNSPDQSNTPTLTPTSMPTYSQIPNTGAENFIYVLIGLMTLGGSSAILLAKKKTL